MSRTNFTFARGRGSPFLPGWVVTTWARSRGQGAAGGGKWEEGRGPGAGEMTDTPSRVTHSFTPSTRRRHSALESEGARGVERLAAGRAKPRTPNFLLFNLSGEGGSFLPYQLLPHFSLCFCSMSLPLSDLPVPLISAHRPHPQSCPTFLPGLHSTWHSSSAPGSPAGV